MPPWLSYKNYEIQSVTTFLASGQWQVEVRVFFHDGRQVGNWGGLVPAYYATEEEAFQAGKAYGRQWVDSLVTPVQIAEAQRLAREWKPKEP